MVSFLTIGAKRRHCFANFANQFYILMLGLFYKLHKFVSNWQVAVEVATYEYLMITRTSK